MSEVWIKTDKELEGIYEYSDTTAMNIAKLKDKYDIRIYYNKGNRKIEIFPVGEPGKLQSYELRDPKKPDDTPATLRLNGEEYNVLNIPELEKQLPIPVLIIEKKR